MPKASKDQLLVKELPNETLVYDESTHKAHCLNQSAALIWKHCDGRTSVAKLAKLLGQETKSEASEPTVWLAIHQLRASHLLEQPTAIPGINMSRRDVARALGIAAIAVPLVTSIIAPTAAEAASCISQSQDCTVGSTPCCAGLTCSNGSCVPATP